jgi:ferrous iron transport protein A
MRAAPMAACRPAEVAATTLDRVSSGRRAEVLEIVGGCEACRRLGPLGVFPGAELRVRRAAPMGGPVLIEVGGSTVAVGRGLARRIRVRMLE